MDKKGDMPTILLFVVTVVLVITALFSFASFRDKFASASEGVGVVMSDVVFFERYVLKEAEIAAEETVEELIVETTSFDLEEDELEERFKRNVLKNKLVVKGVDDFYGKVSKRDFSFKREGESYVLSMDDLFVYSENDANFLKRRFSFRVIINETAVLENVEVKRPSFK
jgi:hypothetical protein